MADIDADHARRAALQQHVGEPAGALADVEAGQALDSQARSRQRTLELEPAARYEAQLGVVGHLELAGIGQVLAGLARHGPRAARTPAHRAAFDQALGGRACRRKAALHEELIGAHRRGRVVVALVVVAQ